MVRFLNRLLKSGKKLKKYRVGSVFPWLKGLSPGKFIRFFTPVVLALFVLLTLLPVAPNVQTVPHTDSSVFLYEGQRILQGEIPYRDVWDHKGPLIYYLDALGLGATGGSRWGVWALEVLAVFAATWFAYDLLKNLFGFWPAILGSLFFLIELGFVLDGGNLVEEFALPFQFLLIWLFWRASLRPNLLLWGLIGVSAALCFLLRPNIIGLPLAIAAFLVWSAFGKDRKNAHRQILAAFVGGIVVLGAALLYFYFNNGLVDLWDQMFVFNFAYNAADLSANWNSLQFGLTVLGSGALFGIAGWVLVLTVLRESARFAKMRGLLIVLGFALPLEIVLTILSGRTYPHYYISWLPVLASSLAFFVYYLSLAVPEKQKSPLGRQEMARLVSLTLVFAFVAFPAGKLLPAFLSHVGTFIDARGLPSVDLVGSRIEPTLIFLNQNTKPSEPVLVWGNALAINVLSNRASPSRFAYQIALVQPGYTNQAVVAEFLQDLENHPNAIIIDVYPNPPFYPLDISADLIPPGLQRIYDYIHSHYSAAETLGRGGWQVYRPR